MNGISRPIISDSMDPPPPATRLKVIVVAPEKSMVVQVLLSLNCWVSASCTAVCGRGSRYIRHSALVDRYLEIDFDGSDDACFIDYVNTLEQQSPGQLVMAADTAGNRLINRVQGRLEATCVAGPSDDLLDVLDDKWQFHQLCSKIGLNTPQTLYVPVKHVIDFDAAAATLGLPFFVKPAQGAQSRGACEIASRNDLRRMILGNRTHDYGPLVLQRFIRGIDVGVNVCAFDGRISAIAVQQRQPPQLPDSPIEFVDLPDLESAAHTLCLATTYGGVMNIDARIETGTGKVWLLEANPRYWHSLSASTWAGLNFVAEHLTGPRTGRALRMLCSGTADTFHHPLVRPRLLRPMFFGNQAQRRMARLMSVELCTLMNSLRTLVKERHPAAASN